MKKQTVFLFFPLLALLSQAQDRMTPELLWKLHRVTGIGLTKDKTGLVYTASTPNADENKSNRKTYLLTLATNDVKEIPSGDSLVTNTRLSPDGKWIITSKEVKLQKVYGKDYYPDLQKSTVQIYESLGYRHWDEWEDGAYGHVLVQPVENGKPSGEGKDIMEGLPYDCPQKPFGGDEDFIWRPDGKAVIYVTKPLSGTKYAYSTNTDIFQYDIETGKTINLSQGMMGYDINPAFSSKGELAWLSMKREGYEADKQDIVVKTDKGIINLTASWDNSVDAFKWSNDGQSIFFDAAVEGAKHLFRIDNVFSKPVIRQITKGDFDVADIVAQNGNTLIVSRTDMNHAAELYSVDATTGNMKQLTHVNDDVYNKIALSKVEKRSVTTTDNKQMTVWVIYPPGFDPAKKYPTLLYCQGGPQSPLTQSYSFRWNFQLMAANGYIVVAPNRRGMYGHGQTWNEEISKDWGGQVMKDYLSAIDVVSKERYVDTSRRGCVGASYGGYSVYYLAGMHKARFKTFIAHDGIFDTRSMSGTTEELWFTNWDFGGPYWDKNNKAAQKTYNEFNPINYVDKWTAPIMIVQGGKDYRVPIEQGLQAFYAAQARGLKSKLLYFPDENPLGVETAKCACMATGVL